MVMNGGFPSAFRIASQGKKTTLFLCVSGMCIRVCKPEDNW